MAPLVNDVFFYQTANQMPEWAGFGFPLPETKTKDYAKRFPQPTLCPNQNLLFAQTYPILGPHLASLFMATLKHFDVYFIVCLEFQPRSDRGYARHCRRDSLTLVVK